MYDGHTGREREAKAAQVDGRGKNGTSGKLEGGDISRRGPRS